MSPTASPTITFQVRTDKKRADGTAPIRLRAWFAGQSAYMSTGVRVKPKDWHKGKQRVRQSCAMSKLYNRRLDEIYREAISIAFNTASASGVVSELTGGGQSFTGYAEGLMEEMTQDGAYWRRKKTAGLLRKVRAVLGENVTWAALSPKALRAIERYMREELGNAENTVHGEMSRLRALVRHGIRDGAIKPNLDPFVRYQMPGLVVTERRKLTVEEVRRIAGLTLKWGTRLRTVRDAWMIAYFGGGIRVSDLLLLGEKNINGDRLEYRSQKSSKLLSIELPPSGVKILAPYQKALHKRMMQSPSTGPSPYLFDSLMAQGDDKSKESVRRRQQNGTVKMNRALKVIAVEAGLDPEGFSTHISRHSFAQYANQQGGSPQALMGLLGHSKFQTFQRYIKSLDHEQGDKITRSMWKSAGF